MAEKKIAAGWGGNESLYEQYSNDVLALTRSQDWFDYLNFQRSFYGYSFANTMLIHCQRKNATQVASAKVWTTNKRSVKENAKPIKIWVPIFAKSKDDDEKSKKPFFILGNVYDVSDTEGAVIPKIVHPLDGKTRRELYVALKEFTKENKITLRENVDLGEINGVWQKHGNTISLSDKLSPAMKVKTLAHELGHALMHNKVEISNENKSICELQAESVAFLVCGSLDLDSSDYSIGYGAGFGSEMGTLSEEAVRKRLVKNAKVVQSTASLISRGVLKELDKNIGGVVI
jgi:hypothetical protein